MNPNRTKYLFHYREPGGLGQRLTSDALLYARHRNLERKFREACSSSPHTQHHPHKENQLEHRIIGDLVVFVQKSLPAVQIRKLLLYT